MTPSEFTDNLILVLNAAKCQFKNFLLSMSKKDSEERNEECFPNRKFRTYLISLLPDLLTCCSPFGEDLPDGQLPHLSEILNQDTLRSVLSDQLSEPLTKVSLLQSLRSLAIFMPGIGIAQLLRSAFGPSIMEPPFPTCMSGMIATIQGITASVNPSTDTEQTNSQQTDLSSSRKRPLSPDGDREVEDTLPPLPSTRNWLKRQKTDSSQICSSE